MRDGRLWMALLAGAALAWAALGSRAVGAEERPGRTRCHGFAHDPDAEVDTRDGSTPLGRWVVAQEDAGWRVQDVELDEVVKASGTLEGWANVCMVPVH